MYEINPDWLNNPSTEPSKENAEDLAITISRLQAQKKEYEAKAKELGKQIEELSKTLNTVMLGIGEESFVQNGLSYERSWKTSVSVLDDKQPELFQKLRDQGLGFIIKENIPAATLKKFVLEKKLENGGELPSWLKECVAMEQQESITVKKVPVKKTKTITENPEQIRERKNAAIKDQLLDGMDLIGYSLDTYASTENNLRFISYMHRDMLPIFFSSWNEVSDYLALVEKDIDDPNIVAQIEAYRDFNHDDIDTGLDI